ncbi:hypothetical protein AMS68_001251 [Peltaster fructicola]|uniref:DUF7918 domain-containing protein n=1 Tax=Peltaster fructicola TaxID=286661 RepID=A0A6H0XLY0_9PEZI|nr:hypothetical protein AMS68_001251 [Peltaster fructicola]
MPCFKGLAVSIHTPEGPLPEHSIQKQSRASRISSYIPVPPAKVPKDSLTGKPEQSTFAISITLLTPGLNVPYSTPKPTISDPHPGPRVVGGLPGYGNDRGSYTPVIPPYVPRTASPNETIAAYIYFDGRVKEEVATLLRRGEETWVNSRWVSVPESEGGGLAEREFLFREVGLERWLNGLDLEGSKNKQETIERRQRRMERRRRKKKDQPDVDSDDEELLGSRRPDRTSVLRYGSDGGSPVEDIMHDDDLFSSNSDSDDEPPQAEATGQIKVALFRVLASGEIKRGEYSPQFDAHDDDEDISGNGNADGDEEVDHTTSFAKPKTLDPKTISTQTVTGLDPPDSPYAIFTFMYRGEKQLRKMGILADAEAAQKPVVTPKATKGPDFSKLGPLKQTGTVGFSGYRDEARKAMGPKDADAMDSDDDDEGRGATEGADDEAKQDNGKLLSPEDAKRTGELADGVKKIKLKRQHSAEPLSELSSTRKSPHLNTSGSPAAGTPQSTNSLAANPGTPPADEPSMTLGNDLPDTIGSPYKKQRPSLAGIDESTLSTLTALSDADPASNVEPKFMELQHTLGGHQTLGAGTTDVDEELSRKLRGQPDKLYTIAIPPRKVAKAGIGKRRAVSDPSDDGEVPASEGPLLAYLSGPQRIFSPLAHPLSRVSNVSEASSSSNPHGLLAPSSSRVAKVYTVPGAGVYSQENMDATK